MEAEDCAVFEYPRAVQSFAGWVYLVSFWYDGIPFDYVAEAGADITSEEEAEIAAKRQGLLQRARRMFLEHVYLEVQH